MSSDDHDYDLTTREGFMSRTDQVTRRRIPARFRDAVATEPGITTWCDSLTRAYAAGDLAAVTPLLITGPTGVGKTYQAYGAIRRIAASGVVIGWLASSMPDLYASLRPREGADSWTEFERWAETPLLLLDDLGAAKDSEWTEEILYRLINHRSAYMRPSIITTNLPRRNAPGKPSLQTVLSERVYSRLAECAVVALKGRDRRLGAS
jgi:DNA replication protein DnaC